MKAEIVDIQKNGIVVQMINSEHCEKKCGSCTGCSGFFGKKNFGDKIILKPHNFKTLDKIKIGDIIEFEFKDKYYILSVTLIFFIPAVLALISLALLFHYQTDVKYSILITLFVIFTYYIFIRNTIKKISESIVVNTL